MSENVQGSGDVDEQYKQMIDTLLQYLSNNKWPNIPREEYEGRVKRARELLEKHKMDAMVLYSPINWWYYGGFTDPAQMHNEIWRTALVVSQEHDPVAVADFNFIWTLVHNSWLEDYRLHSEATHPFCRTVRSGTDFYGLLFDTLKDLGLDNKTIGLETGPEIATYLSIDEYLMIKERLTEAKVVSADPVICAQRMIKTPYEQEIMREGCRRACLCVREAFDSIHPGVNEMELHKAFWRKAVELDLVESPIHATWLCFTGNPAETIGGQRWISGPADRIIKVGDFGHFDCGPTYKMYEMDFQRAFHVGEPSMETMHYFEIGNAAFQETIAAMKPGVPIKNLFKISIDVLEDRGYFEGHTIKFIGHGEGLANHEPPWLTADEETELEPGMVLAVEIGAFDSQGIHFGGMNEDILLVTEEGTENFTAPYLSTDMHIFR